MKKHALLAGTLAFAGFLPTPDACAIILYGEGNSANTTAAGAPDGLPYDSVGRLAGGSAVYLGNGYVLTANHVATGAVTFGGTNYAVDSTFGAVQVAAGVDLKIFRLATLPNVSAVNLFSGNADTLIGQTAYNVGWGVGRDASVPVNSETVAWGNGATRAHRWGTQTVAATDSIPAGTGYPYSYEALITYANTDSPNAAALTFYDSGSALFANIGGTWYLTGIATAVKINGTTKFGTGTTGDFNILVDVSACQNRIAAVIPEPSTWAIAGGLFAGVCALAARRRFRSSP